MRQLRLRFVLLFCVSLSVSMSAFGATISTSENLGALLNGGNLTVGSFVIDGFSAIETSSGTSIQAIDPSQVTVNASFDSDSGKLDVDFESFVAFANGGDFYDYFLVFEIDSPIGIMNAGLLQVGGGAGPATTNITETISWNDSLGAANLTTDDGTPSATAVLAGNPTSIRVAKDILVKSFPSDNGGFSAQISTFSQTYMVVPESGSFALMLMGFVVLGFRSRR